jgi:hypothetical protein
MSDRAFALTCFFRWSQFGHSANLIWGARVWRRSAIADKMRKTTNKPNAQTNKQTKRARRQTEAKQCGTGTGFTYLL